MLLPCWLINLCLGCSWHQVRSLSGRPPMDDWWQWQFDEICANRSSRMIWTNASRCVSLWSISLSFDTFVSLSVRFPYRVADTDFSQPVPRAPPLLRPNATCHGRPPWSLGIQLKGSHKVHIVSSQFLVATLMGGYHFFGGKRKWRTTHLMSMGQVRFDDSVWPILYALTNQFCTFILIQSWVIMS